MQTKSSKSVVMPIVIITIGGLLVLSASFFLYYGFFLLIRWLVGVGDESSLSMGMIRLSFATLYALLYLCLHKIKRWELTKATLLVGPLGVFVAILTLNNYQQLTFALFLVTGFLAVVLTLLRVFKKPWFYYYAVGVALIPALLYAWPR